MTDQALLLSALLLPLAGAAGIMFCGRWPNLREAVTLLTAGALGLIVINLYLRLQAGAMLAIDLAEPLPGLALRLEVEPLGMLFALVAGVLWFITSIYAIGYMRGHHEQNQTRFYALFAVSIGLLHKGRIEHGVVYDPMRQELFTASRGEGAQLDGRRIRVSKQITLEHALIGTGFPFRAGGMTIEPYLRMLQKAIASTSGVRRAGSAALDLCYVAAGRLDAYWETGLAPWDLAAGTLIIREAGGIVSGLDGSEDFLDAGHVLCGNPKIYAGLAKLFSNEIRETFPK